VYDSFDSSRDCRPSCPKFNERSKNVSERNTDPVTGAIVKVTEKTRAKMDAIDNPGLSQVPTFMLVGCGLLLVVFVGITCACWKNINRALKPKIENGESLARSDGVTHDEAAIEMSGYGKGAGKGNDYYAY
jgi:hypothetical protein